MKFREYGPPKNYPDAGPGVFLAGPIQGAPDWQAEAVGHIKTVVKQQDLNVSAFNPRAKNIGGHSKTEQIAWEKNFLQVSRERGAVMFWFAAQDLTQKNYPKGRSYAQTSRIEFGRAMGWKDYDPSVQLAFGIEPGYVGGNEEYLRDCAREYDLQVYQDLGELCSHAVRLVVTRV